VAILSLGAIARENALAVVAFALIFAVLAAVALRRTWCSVTLGDGALTVANPPRRYTIGWDEIADVRRSAKTGGVRVVRADGSKVLVLALSGERSDLRRAADPWIGEIRQRAASAAGR
jgi:hypothetical protein